MEHYTTPGEAYLFGWLVPGLGHWQTGHRGRAKFYFGLLISLFVIGELMSRGGAVTLTEHPFYFFLGQWWCAGVGIVGSILNWIVGGGGHQFENTYELGQLFVTCASVLNILVFLDLFYHLDPPEPRGQS